MDPFAVDGGCLLVHFFPKLLKFLQSELAIVIFASCMTVSTTSSGSDRAAQWLFLWPKIKHKFTGIE